MAEQPIKSSEIIENGLFDDAIKQSEIMISKLKELQVQQVQNLTVSKEYIASFSGKGSKALSDLSKETVKVNATLEQYEKTQLGLIEIEKQQAKLKSELSKATREELKLTKDLAKEEANRVKNYNNQNSEYKKASDNLRDLKKALKDLSIAGKEDTKEFKELNKQFEELDKRVRKADNSVGDFQRNVGNYPKQLKEMQKALMDLEPGTEEFIRLSKEAGLLKDKISDAKDATKAFATESKATTAKNLFGQIGNDLADLDFKGAAEKASTFASVVRSITFAEVTSGLKAFGTAILDVGKALLLNPFTAIAAGVAALAYAAYKVYTTFQLLNTQTETLNEALKTTSDRVAKLTKLQEEYYLRIRVAQGKITEEQAEAIKLDGKYAEERTKLAKEYAANVLKIAEDLGISIEDNDSKRLNRNKLFQTLTFGAAKVADETEKLKIKKFNEEKKKLDELFFKDNKELTKTQLAEKNAIKSEDDAEELKKTKETNEEKRKITIENLKKLRDEQDKIDKEARDREADAINREADRYDREKAKEKAERLQNEKDWQEALLFVEKDAEKTREEFEKKNAEAKKARQEQELKNAIETSQKILDSISNEVAKESELRQKGFDKQISDTQKNIETQRKLAEKGAQNTLVEEEANKVKLERQKEIEKQQEIKRQKALAFFKLFASYADKDPNTALQKALRDTVIAEAVSGAFIDGTENVERDLKGNKVHNGTDGYVIAVDGRERILNPDQNEKIGNLSNEALADLAYKHNNGLLESAKFGVMQSSSFADNIKNSALLMETVALRKEMQDIKQAIKSRPISNFQFDGYGDFIKTTIEDGFKKTTRYKQNKPRI